MIEDRIKIKINNIIYNRTDNTTYCEIIYAVYINKFPIQDNLYVKRETECKTPDTFDISYGKNLSRAYAELGIYKDIIHRYASDIVLSAYMNYYNNNYYKMYQCMANTRKYYKNLIKKQHKYINSLLKK